jgi:hypothetical protein
MARLGVIVVGQPRYLWDAGDDWRRSLGPRAERLQPYGELRDAGVRFAISTDAPVASYRPMDTLASALLRRTSGGAVVGETHRLDIGEALRAYTIDAARSFFVDGVVGSLEPGKLADLVVLDADPLETPAGRLPEIGTVLTMVGGRSSGLTSRGRVVSRDGRRIVAPEQDADVGLGWQPRGASRSANTQSGCQPPATSGVSVHASGRPCSKVRRSTGVRRSSAIVSGRKPSSGREDVDTIVSKRRIPRHHEGAHPPGLGDQYPVERVTMMRRQGGRPLGVGAGDRQDVEPRLSHCPDEPRGCRELAERTLDLDLPDRDRGDQHIGRRIRDRGARRAGELRIVRQPPQHGVGIQDQDHCSNALTN